MWLNQIKKVQSQINNEEIGTKGQHRARQDDTINRSAYVQGFRHNNGPKSNQQGIKNLDRTE